MGGSVGFTIREESGKEHRMCRWTNPTPYFINHSKFISKDEQHLKKYLEMQDPYRVNEYCLAPEGYGLVVVDYKTSTVLYHQSYCNYGIILPASISLCLMNERQSKENSGEVQDFKTLFEQNKIKAVELLEEGLKTVDISKLAFDKILERCNIRSTIFKKERWYQILIDMNPWTVKRFGESLSEINAFKKAIVDLGFTLTKEEETMWDDFKKNYEDQE